MFPFHFSSLPFFRSFNSNFKWPLFFSLIKFTLMISFGFHFIAMILLSAGEQRAQIKWNFHSKNEKQENFSFHGIFTIFFLFLPSLLNNGEESGGEKKVIGKESGAKGAFSQQEFALSMQDMMGETILQTKFIIFSPLPLALAPFLCHARN